MCVSDGNHITLFYRSYTSLAGEDILHPPSEYIFSGGCSSTSFFQYNVRVAAAISSPDRLYCAKPGRAVPLRYSVWRLVLQRLEQADCPFSVKVDVQAEIYLYGNRTVIHHLRGVRAQVFYRSDTDFLKTVVISGITFDVQVHDCLV